MKISRKSKDTENEEIRQELIAAIGLATHDFQRATDGFDDLVAQHVDLNRTDLRCLDWLFDGPKTAGQLALTLSLSTAAVTTLVDRLERRGIVHRVRDPADRRKVLVEMTPEGWRLTNRFYAPLALEGAAMLEDYNTEQLTTIRDHVIAATELLEMHQVELRAQLARARPSASPPPAAE